MTMTALDRAPTLTRIVYMIEDDWCGRQELGLPAQCGDCGEGVPCGSCSRGRPDGL
jgi:hypothetical protein